MRMEYNTEVYQMLTSDPSRYTFQANNRKDITFESRYEEYPSEQVDADDDQQSSSDSSTVDGGKKASNNSTVPAGSAKSKKATEGDNQQTSTPAQSPKEKTSGSTNATAVSKDSTKFVNGWYMSDDGKYAIKPYNLKKIHDGYSIAIQIRQESLQMIIYDSTLKFNVGDIILKSLVKDKAVQEFKYVSNGQYSFDIVCNYAIDGLPDTSDATVSKNYTLTIE